MRKKSSLSRDFKEPVCSLYAVNLLQFKEPDGALSPKFVSPLGSGVTKNCQNRQITTIKVKEIRQKHEKNML